MYLNDIKKYDKLFFKDNYYDYNKLFYGDMFNSADNNEYYIRKFIFASFVYNITRNSIFGERHI